MMKLSNGAILTASFEYAGYSDYWSGHGEADNEDHKEFLLYAFYGRNTSLADIVNQLVEDSWNGPAAFGLPEEVTDSDVREALLTGMLNDLGRADYNDGVIAECSANWGADAECSECEASLADVDDGDPCPACGDWNDCGESPIFVAILDYEYPEGYEHPADDADNADDADDADDADRVRLEGMPKLEGMQL